ncbi:ribosome maturation factor RimP [Polymorphobacter multimanifer]|uniref:Ribosome maturation factor RimP n=1 Tax=Polymorphobacter multimanifer TaxID=1070431 RepID=A0A841L6X0_9SPHN|nr:ribosome maturation factor [Polymorphobacter multimanifer]MBB6228170.1 ribosome maturation factor RimP [Polymorphobacter multimanifer]
MSLNTTLEAIIAPIVADLGFALVRVQMNGRAGGSQTLQIMAEDPVTGQLTIAQCSAISRALDEPLEAADPIEGEYSLEVSSPGIDRLLTRLADWARWAGHEVRLKLAAAAEDGTISRKTTAMKAVIIGHEGDMVHLDMPGTGKMNVPFGQIVSAKLVLTNKLIAATRPLDMGDADEMIDEPGIETDAENDN